MKNTLRMACVFLLAAALCLSLAACGNKSESAGTEPEATATPEPVTGVDQQGPAAATVQPEPEPTAAPTPEPTPEPPRDPTSVKLQYEGEDVTALSFLSSAVFQLHAVTDNGVTGGTWTSSDASAASVDENGVVTCWKAGSPKITYTIGNISASCTLTITEPTVRIFFAGAVKNDISISSLYGFEVPLTAVVTPEGSEVTWSSDDTSIASVSETGLVTAHKMGTTNINCKCGTAKATCIVRVLENPPAWLAPTPAPDDTTPRIVITYAGSANSDFTMNVGQALDMEYVLYNIDPSTAVVTWSIQDPAYASVDQNGVIVALKSTFGIEPLRNYTVLTATCGDYSCESYVFIKKDG